jgi:hypothetical protein
VGGGEVAYQVSAGVAAGGSVTGQRFIGQFIDQFVGAVDLSFPGHKGHFGK